MGPFYLVSSPLIKCNCTIIIRKKVFSIIIFSFVLQHCSINVLFCVLPEISEYSRTVIREAGVFVFAEVADMGLVLQWDRGTRTYLTLDQRWKNKVRRGAAVGQVHPHLPHSRPAMAEQGEARCCSDTGAPAPTSRSTSPGRTRKRKVLTMVHQFTH